VANLKPNLIYLAIGDLKVTQIHRFETGYQQLKESGFEGGITIVTD
jgi:hypothetical protein